MRVRRFALRAFSICACTATLTFGLAAAPAQAASVIASGPVTSGIAGYCLDLGGGQSYDGNKIDIWNCNQYGPAQTWNVMDDGTLQIGGRCMDVSGGATGNGTLVELWDCNGNPAQQWRQQGNALVNPQSGRCLDDPNW